MLLTNWLSSLTSRIRKRPVYRSRERRAIRKRWHAAVHNQITTAEVLEDRTLLTTYFVDDSLVITNDQGATGLDAGDTVTFASGEAGETAGLIFGDNAFDTIQDAITAAAASGDTIQVAAGTYSGLISLNKQVDLLGAQTGVDARGRVGTLDDSLSSIIAPAGGTGLDLQGGSAGTTIDGFTFSGGTRGIVSTSGPIDDLQILNNQFVGFTGSGVFLDNSGDDITVHQNVVDGTSQVGGGGIFHLDQDTFDGFHFTSNWVLNGATGFFVDGTRNVSSSASRDPLFEDNLFDGNGAGANFGRFGVENAVVQNNVFSNNAFDGLQGGIQNSLITMNTFDTNDRAGLRLTGFGGTGDPTRGAQGNIVEENIFLNNGAGTSATGYGDVRLDDQFDGTISTNTFFNNSFGSTVAVFNNETSGEVVDFSGNSWSTNDDDAVILKLDGAGALAVDFTFYLGNGTDTDGGTAGFQGDFSTLHVTALGAQTGSPDRIAEALAAVTPGGTVKINSGTYVETVNTTATGIDKSVTLAPGNSPGQVVINGDLILNGDDTLDIEINGQTAGSGYDQFIVNGAVGLNNAVLNLPNTYTPVDGDKFTLIDNDAADGITGEFVGYPEGHEFTDFLGSGLNAYLTYFGGDGNDVVIHMEDSTPELTVPDNDAADQYTLEIVGGNFVLSETVSGAIISTFPVAALNGPLVIYGENDEDDTLTIDLDTIDHTTDIQIEFRGGTGGNDTLILERTGAVNSVEHVFTSASDGSIFLDGEAAATITYTGLEPISDTILADNRTFSYLGGAETITLSDFGGANDDTSLIGSTLGESVDFDHSTLDTITIRTIDGSGADTININGVDGEFDANLIVTAGTDDTINTGTVNIGGGALDLTAGQVNVNGAFTTTGTVDILTTAADITFDAAGSINAGTSEIDLFAFFNVESLNVTTTTEVRVTANGGGINDLTGNALITADRVELVAGGAGGITGIETNVNTLAASAAGGAFSIDNTGDLEIGSVNGLNGITANNSTIFVTTTGALTINQAVSADTVGWLRSVDAGGAGQDLNVNAGVTSTSGNLNLQAGDNLNLATGVTLNAAANMILNIDNLSADVDGGIANLNGILTAGADITVNGGAQADQVIIDSNGGPSNNGGTVDGIQSLFTFVGGGGSDELIVDDSGDNTGDNIIIQNTAPGVGVVIGAGAVTLSYEDLEDLTLYSGTDADDITVNPNISTAINIVGGDPTTAPGDSLTYLTPATQGSTYTPTGADSGTISATGGFQTVTFDEIESVTLGGSVTVTGTADDDVLTITATSANAGTYQIVSGGVPGPVININSITDFTFNGGDGDDTLIINNPAGSLFNPSGGIFFNGQGEDVDGDTLQILGGETTTVEHEFTNASDGFVLYNGTTSITYTGLEPITDAIAATNRIFSYAGGDETITLNDDIGAVADYSQIGSTLGELVTFLNPTDSLEIDASASGGSDTDVIDIEGIDVNFDADLSVIGSVGDDDSVNFEATNIGAGNLFVDVDGTVTIYDQFTTTGTVGINAGLIDFFAGPFTLSAGAGLSQLNSDTDILLGEIASAGDVALDATGAIIDDNGVTNNISATNVILTAGTDIGAGDALDLDVGALEASAGDAINVANSSGATLTVGGLTGSIDGLEAGTGISLTTDADLENSEDMVSTNGLVDLSSSGGSIIMGDSTQVTASNGSIVLTADNNVELELLSASADVTVTATTGGITDGNDDVTNNISAVNATLNAGTGAGAGNALETTITALEANVGAGLEVDDAGTLNIGFGGGINGVEVGAPSRITSTGTMTVTEDISSSGPGGNLQLENTGGNFLLNTGATIDVAGGFSIQVDSANDLTVDGTVQTAAGAITLRADNDLNLGADALIDTVTGGATVTLTADADVPAGGAFFQGDGTGLVNARGGSLNVSATGNITLADLQSAGGTVTITSSGGAIVDGTDPGEAPLITADEAALSAVNGIGTPTPDEDIDTAVGTLSASTTNNDVVVSNTGALEIGDVASLFGVTASNGNVTITAASPLTVASDVTGSGTVTLTAADSAGAGDDLTINTLVTVRSTGADVELNAGDDFTLTAGGTVQAASTITINVDPITDGTGATVDLLGNVDATQTTINGGDDADTFNILPTEDSPIDIVGGDPTFVDPAPRDTLNLDFSNVTAPALTLGMGPGSGTFDFIAPDTEQAVSYSEIEDVNTGGTGDYHLVLDMVASGFETTGVVDTPDTIDVALDGTGDNLLIDVNTVNFFAGNDDDILSFTVLGSDDSDTLNINESGGGLPLFTTAAPAGIPGSNGSHLNTAADTYLNDEYTGPYTVDNITIHYDGRTGVDAVNLNLTTNHDVGYFADDLNGGSASGNLVSATTVGTDIDLGLSFSSVEGVGVSGAAGGTLRADASATPDTTGLTITDAAGAGVSRIGGNGGFTPLLFDGFDGLEVYSGTGDELIDLISLDATTTLSTVLLDGDDVFAAEDTGADTIRVRSTPGSLTVTIRGGLGDDLVQVFDDGDTVDNILANLVVDGEAGSNTLTIIDSGDTSGDSVTVTSTTVEGLAGATGTDVTYGNITTLNVTTTDGDDGIGVDLATEEQLDTVTINGADGNDSFTLLSSTSTGVENLLNGDDGTDSFVFEDSFQLRGFIDGGSDVDTIDYSGYDPFVHVQLSGLGTTDGFQGYEINDGTLGNGSILGTGPGGTGFDNIDNLLGSGNADTLEGPDLNNYWGITSTDAGFIIADRPNLASGRPTVIPGDGIPVGAEQRLDFTSFQNLIGGNQDDRFDLSDTAGLTGSLNGDLGNDSLDYRDYNSGVTVDLFLGTATNIDGGLAAGTGGGDDDNSIENVFGGDGNDNITGDNDHNILGDGLGNDNLDGGGFDLGGGVIRGSGNGGNDVFLMEPGAGGSADVITDIHGNDTVDFRFASAGVVFDVDLINVAQEVFGGNTVELRQIQPQQPDTNPSFMENVVGSEFGDLIFIDPLSQDGNFPIDGPPVLRSADGRGGTDTLDFDAKGQAVIDTGYSLTADGVGTVQYLNFENVQPFEDNPAVIVDNGDLGFSLGGEWPFHPNGTAAVIDGIGYDDDIHFAHQQGHAGLAQAFWEFYGLTPGFYRVSVTWPVSANPTAVAQAASDAPYTVFDGSRSEIGSTALFLDDFTLDQQVEPDSFLADGVAWQVLDTFEVTSRTLTVMLTNLTNGKISADAVRIERVDATGPEVELQDTTVVDEPPTLLVDGHPGGIDFGTTELLTDVTHTFEITNTGGAALDISNIVIPTGFSTDLVAQSVAAGDMIEFEITMDSMTFGDRSGLFSFETNDTDETVFNLQVHGRVSNVVIIDDGDTGFDPGAAGFESYPGIINGGRHGYEGDITAAVPNQPGNTPVPDPAVATWTFTDLADGFYRVSTTWPAYYNRAADAPFTLDSNGNTFSVDVDQTVHPSSFVEDGTAWFDLNGMFEVSGGELVVTLTNDADSAPRDHYTLSAGVIADAIRIEYLATPDLEVTVDGGTVVEDDTGLVDFGTTIPGVPVTKTFTITNTGADDVTVTGLVDFPPGFSIDPNSDFGTDDTPVVLTSGATIDFIIQFDGGTTGTTFGEISFITNDPDEQPYNFQVTGTAGPATVGINDADFATSGTWNGYVPGAVGDPTFLYTYAGTGSNTATWTFDVEPGRYQVVAHWYVHPDISPDGRAAATDAPYTIYSDVTPVTTVDVSHQTSSDDYLSDGLFWEYIGDPVEITDDILRVQLSDNANGVVYADEVRIFRVVDPVIKVEVDGETLEDGATVDFEETIVGAPVAKTFTVTNFGERNLALDTINVPTGFTLISGLGDTNLAPGASTTFTLQMNAATVGSFGGMVSFGADLADQNPFNFTVTGSADETMIVDNGDLAYSTTGGLWDQNTRYRPDNLGFYLLDQDILPGGNQPGTNTATWEFANLGAGTYYLSSHWMQHSSYAPNAQFVISGIAGGDITVFQDQRFAPNDFTDAGTTWEELGYFQVEAGDTLTVTLIDDGATGHLAADAMRLELIPPGSTATEIEVLAGATSLTSTVSSVDLGTAFYGETISQTFTIWNTGTATLDLSSGVSLPPGFTLSAPLGLTSVAVGHSTTFEVSFSSTGAAGPVGGTVEIDTNDADEDPFSFTISAAMTDVLILDNGDAGYSSSGNWSNRLYDNNYFETDAQQLYPGESGTATWNITSLPAGDYTVWTTWYAHISQATNAEYVVSGGVGPVVLNQEIAPNDLNDAGKDWEMLGTLSVGAGGAITVSLSDNGPANGIVTADAIRIQRTGPLRAAGGASGTSSPAITQSDLDSVVDAALSYWEAAGLSETQLALMQSVNFVLTDLPDAMLGGAAGTTVLIDVNAAGYGWFVDGTPFDSSEFTLTADGRLLAGAGSEAAGQMDLLTVVLHELGHTAGGADLETEGELMSETLDLAERRLPSADDLDDFFSTLNGGDNPLLD